MTSPHPQRFLDPALVLSAAQLKAGDTFSDFGCGNGFYVIPAAKIVGSSGTVLAVDILEDALEATASATQLNNLRNVKLLRSDLENPLHAAKIPAGSCDMVLAANIMHQAKAKDQVIRGAYRCLRTGGRFLVVEWDKNATSPFGPPFTERMDRNEVTQMAQNAGLRLMYEIPTDPYHYGLVFLK